MKKLLKYRLPLLFLLAFLIRLIAINQSLWLDEATTAITLQRYGLIEIITQFSPADFHPPLYYLVMDVWANLFGYSEIALRMPSVLFSLGTGWVVYKIVQISKCKIQNLKSSFLCGFWAAAFFLFNPLIIYYSQEARMYSMVTFFIAISFYYLIKLLTSNIKHLNKDFWLMNIFLILSFYTFYASIFYIATVFIYVFLIGKTSLTLRVPSPQGENVYAPPAMGGLRGVLPLLPSIFFILLISPLLLQQYAGSREALVSVANWSLVLGKVTLKNALLFPIKFTSGRVSFYPKMIYYALAGGWMAVVASPVILNLPSGRQGWFQDLNIKRFRNKFGMTLFFIVTPLILGALFSLNSPLLQYFRFQYLIVFLSLALYRAVGSGTGVLRYILLIGFLSWSLLYLLFPQFHREDWKHLATQLQQETNVVYMIPSSGDPLRYYAPNVKIRDIQTSNFQRLASHDIIVIPYTADIHGVDYQTRLNAGRYILEEALSYRELMYEHWVKTDIPERLQ